MTLFSAKLGLVQQTIKNIPIRTENARIGYVYDIILDENASDIDTVNVNGETYKNVSLIGCIRFRFGTDSVKPSSELPIAYPFDKNFINLPVINEPVEIYEGNGSKFFYRRIGSDLTPNVNNSSKLIDTSFIKNESVENTSKTYQRVQTTGITKSSNDSNFKYDTFGKYFQPDFKLHKLKLYEGDTVIQSRFGQSIRFSGYNNTEKQLSPTVTIRNGENSISKKNNIDVLTEEDVNRDGSIIAMTSNQYQLPFQPGTVDDGGTSDFETRPESFQNYPSKLIGDQILINSGRLIFSAKNAEMIFYSKKNYGFISDGGLSIDNKLGIDVSVGDNINVVTNSRDVVFYTDNGSIFLGSKDLEPLVKGQQLVDILSELLDALSRQVFRTPAGPSAEGPVNISEFATIKSKLNNILSKLNQTS